MAERGHKAEDGYLIKLVRDRVGEALGGGGSITYEPIGDLAEHVKLLRGKLIEEAVEYLANPCVEELADVLEVLWSLARVDLACPWSVVEVRAKDKRTQRGSFVLGVGMIGHHSVDGRDPVPLEASNAE